MSKRIFKFFTITLISILLLSSFSFAAEIDLDALLDELNDLNLTLEPDLDLLSEPNEGYLPEIEDLDIIEGDLRINTPFANYVLDNIINGNVFITARNFTLDSSNNGGAVQGNMFVTAGTVRITSDLVYTEDDEGNIIITDVNGVSLIGGNTYIIANKVVIESGSEIYKDLYIFARNVEIAPESIIHGSLYIVANNVTLDGTVLGDVYRIHK